MNEQRGEYHIDIGGGKAEHFSKLAREQPQATFVVLDPTITKLPSDAPSNLTLIVWGDYVENGLNWDLPLRNNSADHAYLSFLMGELENNVQTDDDSLEEDFARYKHLITDVKRVLKPTGVLHVAEPRGNIFYVKEILEHESFKIGEPTRIHDEDRTEWIRTFFKIYNMGGKTEEESEALPMEFDAVIAAEQK